MIGKSIGIMKSARQTAAHVCTVLTETAVNGAPTIPILIFVISFIAHEGSFMYVLPFVLFYSFLKVGCFSLGIFGSVKNVFRLAVISAALACVGAFIMLFDFVSIIAFDIGAVVLGTALSVFVPAYKTIKGKLQDHDKFPYLHVESAGTLLMICCFAAIATLAERAQEIILVGYFALTVATLVALFLLIPKDKRPTTPLFNYSKRNPRKIIPVVLLLTLAVSVRTYKQTADGGTAMITFIVATAIIAGVAIYDRETKRPSYELHSILLMQSIIYAMLFSVFRLTSMGYGTMAIMPMLVMLLVQLLMQFFGKRIMTLLKKVNVTNLSVVLVALCDVLLIFSSTMFVGIFGVCLFGFIGQSYISRLQKAEHRISNKHLNFEQQQVKNIGNIIGQTLLIVVLAVVSWFMLGDTTAAQISYAFRIPETYLGGVFTVTGVIMAALMGAQTLALLVASKVKGEQLLIAQH